MIEAIKAFIQSRLSGILAIVLALALVVVLGKSFVESCRGPSVRMSTTTIPSTHHIDLRCDEGRLDAYVKCAPPESEAGQCVASSLAEVRKKCRK